MNLGLVSLSIMLSLGWPAVAANEPTPAPSPTASATPAVVIPGTNATPIPDQPCEQEADGAKFICGVTNVEDWAPVDGTQWIFGSHFVATGKAGYLMIFDSQALTAQTVEPQQIKTGPLDPKYKTCPGAPDFTALSTHGLAIRKTGPTAATLFVVNHGGRESIEIFDIEIPKPSVPGAEVQVNPAGVTVITKPVLTWRGCAVAPKNTYPDAVAPLADGSMLVTSLWNPNDKARTDKLKTGQPVGGLFRWSTGNWNELSEGKTLSGPNGVIASADGKTAYVAVWAAKGVARIKLNKKSGDKPVDVVSTGFYTDNLRWSPDGKSIYVGGQNAPMATLLACIDTDRNNCSDVPFVIDQMDPETLKLTNVIKSGSYGGAGAGTGAIRVGNELWVSSFHADRVARFPADGNVKPNPVPTPVAP